MPGAICDPREVTALILAAGEGRRMGERPKAFLELRERTLLARAIAMASPWAQQIIVAVRAADLARARAVTATLPEGPRVTCIAGGTTRQESVRLALEHANTPAVLLQEVARAWTDPVDFENVLSAVREHPAVVLFRQVRSRDTVAIAEGTALRAILPREKIITLQTPHAYQRATLNFAYALAARDGSAEDSTAALVQRANVPIHLIESAGANIKITYPVDLPPGSRRMQGWSPAIDTPIAHSDAL